MDKLQRAVIATFKHWDLQSTLAGFRIMVTVATKLSYTATENTEMRWWATGRS